MTKDELIAEFEKYSNEFLNFEEVIKPRSKRADLHAFILLNELCPSKRDIIASAEHDQIWLSIDLEELAGIIAKSTVRELVCCGVMCDGDGDSLVMFV